MLVPEEVLFRLRKMALTHPDQECCGLLTDDFQLLPVRNSAPDPRNTFVFDAAEYWSILKDLERQGRKVKAIYHTHPHGSAQPSKADLAYVESSKRSSLIVSINDWKWLEYADRH